MQNRYTYLFFALIATVTIFSSCKKEFSPDPPLEETYDKSIFIGSQNQFIYALNPETGHKKWEFHTNGNIQSSPVVVDDFVFVCSENGTIYKLDAKTGTLLKIYSLGGSILATPVTDKEYI